MARMRKAARLWRDEFQREAAQRATSLCRSTVSNTKSYLLIYGCHIGPVLLISQSMSLPGEFEAFCSQVIKIRTRFDEIPTSNADTRFAFYKLRLEELRSAAEKLPEFAELERALLPLGLGVQLRTKFVTRDFRKIEEGEMRWSPYVSLSELLWQLAIYHDLLDGKPPELIWERIDFSLTEKLTTTLTWLELEGVSLPKKAKFETLSVIILQFSGVKAKFLSRIDRELERLRSDTEDAEFDRIAGISYDQQWGLLTANEAPETAVRHYASLNSMNIDGPPPTRENIIDEFGPDLLALTLCDSGYLNVSNISDTNGDLKASNVTLAHCQAAMSNSPFDLSDSAECFTISSEDCDRFSKLLKRINRAISEARKQDDEELVEATRIYLRARLYEHPKLSWPQFRDERNDVLIRYVICLEKLVLFPQEDKVSNFKGRLSRLLRKGNQDENQVTKGFLQAVCDARNDLVHTRVGKEIEQAKSIRLLCALSDVARRAIACTYLLLGELRISRKELMQNLYDSNRSKLDRIEEKHQRELARTFAREIASSSRVMELPETH